MGGQEEIPGQGTEQNSNNSKTRGLTPYACRGSPEQEEIGRVQTEYGSRRTHAETDPPSPMPRTCPKLTPQKGDGLKLTPLNK